MIADSATVTAPLQLFAEQADKVRRRRVLQALPPKIGYTASLGGNYSFEMRVPDPEDMQALLVDLRPFTLENESVHYHTIANLLARRLTDRELREANEHNHRGWKTVMKGTEAVHIGDMAYDAEKLFKLVVNADMFHLDMSQRAFFERWPRQLQDMARFNVHSVALGMVGVILPQAALIRQALQRRAIDGRPDLQGRAPLLT